MRQPLSDAALRQTWQRMRLCGDFERALQNPPLRQTLELATRAWTRRDARRAERTLDFKRRAAGDPND